MASNLILKPDWRQLTLELRRHYKHLSLVAEEVGISADRLRRIACKGTNSMKYENGVRLILLHEKHVKNKLANKLKNT